MSHGLALTRSKKNPDLFFFYEDSSGELIEIKQTFVDFGNGQTRVVISAPKSVKISRGEQLEKHAPTT